MEFSFMDVDETGHFPSRNFFKMAMCAEMEK